MYEKKTIGQCKVQKLFRALALDIWNIFLEWSVRIMGKPLAFNDSVHKIKKMDNIPRSRQRAYGLP